jgi:hypothetical protein
MSKQWKGFTEDWLKDRLERPISEKVDDFNKIQAERIHQEQIQICIAKGIHAKDEEELHLAVVEYIRLQYPERFPWVHSDMSGFRVGIKARVKLGAMKHSRGFPDVVIYDVGWYLATPTMKVRMKGMALELKHIDARPKPWKINGELSGDIHIQEQAAWLRQFENLGFAAFFCVGFEQARNHIDAFYTTGLPGDPGNPGP